MNQLDEKWKFETSYLNLPKELYALGTPSEVNDPELFIFNAQLANHLNLDFLNQHNQYALSVLSGNYVPSTTSSFAQAYGGHQFGYFNVLGDGRATVLGEIKGIDDERYDIQLKGAGKTPYSRRGDGRATLYSMLREYLISEAMAGLGISTTRSLAVVKSDDPVYREKIHATGVLTRVASSHIRVGTFELVARMGTAHARDWPHEYGVASAQGLIRLPAQRFLARHLRRACKHMKKFNVQSQRMKK